MSAASITRAELQHRAVTLRLQGERAAEQLACSVTLGGRKTARLRMEALEARAQQYEKLIATLADMARLPRKGK